MSGIYIHIPFCRQACSYCDFYFVTRGQLIPAFVDALVNEVISEQIIPVSSAFLPGSLQTIYMGGGTPSRLTLGQFERVIEALKQRFDLSNIREFTVEVNPEDVSAEYLSGLKHLGVTRLSMGIQSFQPHLLAFMHRAHTSRQAHRALECVADAGFASFSVDLIYGNPGQALEHLQNDLTQLLEYQPPHVSAYSLTIEPKTRLGKQHKLGRLNPAVDDDVVAHFHLIRDTLGQHNILQYEVSNYAKPGHEAIHNSAYWRHENYLGLGPAAHSFFWSSDGSSAIRRNNPPDLHAYGLTFDPCQNRKPVAGRTFMPSQQHEIDKEKVQDYPFSDSGTNAGVDSSSSETDNNESVKNYTQTEILLLHKLAEERIMMGLRTRDGITEAELSSRYNYNINEVQRKHIQEFRKEGLIKPEDPIRLTDKGIPLADAITINLL